MEQIDVTNRQKAGGAALLARLGALCRPRRRRGKPSCCVRVSSPIDRPDPATYSQLEQLSSGIQPSWNSPDITTNWVGQNKLLPEAKVTVRNLSATASAIGVRVDSAVSRFGVGFARTPIGSSMVSLAPSQESTLLVPFPQAVLNGEQRVGFHVRLVHPSDPVLVNNEGSQMLEAFATSAQGRTITTAFLVRNPLPTSQPIGVQMLATQPGIVASFSLAPGAFGGFEERSCSVTIAVESWLVGGGGTTHDREVTFVARGADGRIIDGVTFYVAVNS